MVAKKAKAMARYGARYGIRVKKRIAKAEEMSRGRHVCSFCLRKTVKRVAAGIWGCSKCKRRFAAGAYSSYTAVGVVKPSEEV